MKNYCGLVLLVLSGISLQGQSALPDIVTKGLAAYQLSGGKEAMAVWLKGSPLENDTTTKLNVAGGLATIETAFGKMIGSETIRLVQVSPSILRAYVVLKFERGPVFFTFDCYRAAKEWGVFFIDFNSRPSVGLPIDILTGVTGGQSTGTLQPPAPAK